MAQQFIIIGGTSGIGAGISQKLQERGAGVLTVSRRADGLAGVPHISLDITAQDIPVDMIEGSIAGMAYCPGSIRLRPFRSLSQQDFQADWQINLLGAVRALKTLVPKMDKEQGASIVLFSTVAVQQGMPFHASIAAAKGAVEGLTRALAAELAPAIRVNCIAPSLTDTPMSERLLSNDTRRKTSEERHPLKRIGSVDDISSTAAFLLLDSSGWISGQVIGVDGGMSTLRA